MKLIKLYNEYMGPKDERIEAEYGRIYRVGYIIFVIGTCICLFYGIMLGQVANVADKPIHTAIGEGVFSPTYLLMIVLLIAGIVPCWMQIREGIASDHSRMAEVDHIPWGYVLLCSALIGLAIGFCVFTLRVIAEIQIVGLTDVLWFGDMAVGIVIGGIGFAAGIICFGTAFASAIKRRKQLESKLGD